MTVKTMRSVALASALVLGGVNLAFAQGGGQRGTDSDAMDSTAPSQDGAKNTQRQGPTKSSPTGMTSKSKKQKQQQEKEGMK